MGFNQFSPGTQFLWMEERYKVARYLPNNRLRLERECDGEYLTVTHEDLAAALFEGTLFFLNSNGSPRKQLPPTLDDHSPNQQKAAQFRLKVIRPLLLKEGQRRTKQMVDERVAEVKEMQQVGKLPNVRLSRATIYRWLKEYEQRGHDSRALIPRNIDKTKSSSRLQPEVEKIVTAVIDETYYQREVVTIDTVWFEVARQIELENKFVEHEVPLKRPGRSTIVRRIKQRDLEGRMITRRGKREAERAFTQYGQMEQPTRPLQRVEIDHTLTDIIVIDETDNLPAGRLTLTFCIDVATRYPLGFYLGFEPPSYGTVANCLYHAIQKKPDVQSLYDTDNPWLAYGLPHMLVVDNGREFIGKDLSDACQALGIILQQTPVRSPHFKGTVERFFSTLNSKLLHTLVGTTFSNVHSRKDYESLKVAAIRLEELNKMLHITLLDEYAQNNHRGLGGIPAQAWQSLCEKGFYPRVPSSGQELSVLLGRTAKRVIGHGGVELHNLVYNASELGPLRAMSKDRGVRKLKIKYNPHDLGTIHVYDPFRKQYLPAQAKAKAYASGLSLWKHQVISKYCRKHIGKINMSNLARARRKIQAVVDEAIKSQALLKGHKRKARWNGSGHPAPPPPPATDFDKLLGDIVLPDNGRSSEWGFMYDDRE